MATSNSPVRALSRHIGLLALIACAALSGYWLRGTAAPDLTASHQHNETAPEDARTTVWTCSMHPPVRRPEPGDCPICGMDLIPLDEEAHADTGSERRFTTTEASRALMKIQTSPVERRFVEAPVRMVGKVAYDETRLGYITAWVPGRIERLYADYTGVKVSKGDHMVDLYSPDLLAAKEELRRAREALKRMPAGAPAVLRETAEATLTAVRNRLQRWGMTAAQIDRAESGGAASDRITVYAPMGGTVIDRNGQEGMYVETGTRIYTLADLARMWVLLDAYESDLPWLKYGERVTFTTEAYPGDAFEGRIAFIDPFVDPRTRTVKVRVNVDNSDERLKADMFVRAVAHPQVAQGGKVMDPALAGKWISPMHPEIVKDGPGTCDVCGMALVPAEDLGYVPATADASDKPLVIPASAALVTGKRAVVYVEIPDRERPTYEGREIVLGPRAGDHYIVRGGLEEGERVVTEGNFKIDSALQIQAKPSMMNPTEEEGMEVSEAFRAALGKVYEAYLPLHHALAMDDPKAAAAAAESFRRALRDVPNDTLDPAAVPPWIAQYDAMMTNALTLVKAESLGMQRVPFQGVSDALIAAIKRFGVEAGAPVYAAHCPMAFDFEGADWLQASEDILNPYFGDEMLTCGTITATLDDQTDRTDHGGHQHE